MVFVRFRDKQAKSIHKFCQTELFSFSAISMAAGDYFLCFVQRQIAERETTFMTWIHWPDERKEEGVTDSNTQTQGAGAVFKMMLAHHKSFPIREQPKAPAFVSSLRLIAAILFTLGDKPCLWRHVCHRGRGRDNKGGSREKRLGPRKGED